eukprot:TRINITY_DN682_c0_g2_i1.p1 TRINITY_DN682_c0_g2~~TRINITY_DN682_c0_g2_i1.p1  ORF type:complete len:155 (-),score=6.08 TRINITY_DN682_c0_g2_i1:244-708(-)
MELLSLESWISVWRRLRGMTEPRTFSRPASSAETSSTQNVRSFISQLKVTLSKIVDAGHEPAHAAPLQMLLTSFGMADEGSELPLVEKWLHQYLVDNAFNKNLCYREFTGPTMFPIPWYRCVTCGMQNAQGMCATCSQKCHVGHEVECFGKWAA